MVHLGKKEKILHSINETALENAKETAIVCDDAMEKMGES
jgi:predicted membrane-bound spermidine synthase